MPDAWACSDDFRGAITKLVEHWDTWPRVTEELITNSALRYSVMFSFKPCRAIWVRGSPAPRVWVRGPWGLGWLGYVSFVALRAHRSAYLATRTSVTLGTMALHSTNLVNASGRHHLYWELSYTPGQLSCHQVAWILTMNTYTINISMYALHNNLLQFAWK